MDNIIHGANPENLYHSLGITMPENIIDFSTNTNILSWPEIHIDVHRLASNYPDSECTQLREIISSRENISPSRVIFTNGINSAIFILSQIFTEGTAIFQPCYTEYARAFRNAHNIFTLNDAWKFRNVIICNPNNPTGKFIPDISRTIAASPDTVFMIDESYIDFLTRAKPERLIDFHNVIILRSLTKIFHLSGARIGYVIANENIISAMKDLLPSWSVNAFAQELARHFLRDKTFYEATRNFYSVNTPIFMEALRESGFDVMDSDVHYFLVRVKNDIEAVKYLLRHGIAVRHTRNFPGLCGEYIRVATRTPHENEILIEAMKELM